MDSDDVFYTNVWRMVTVMVCTLFLVVGGCSMWRDTLIQEAMIKTANPNAVACVFGGQAAQPLCMLQATQGEK
jgi:hypothetical protein